MERGNEILLARNASFPAGRFSLLAGFVEPGESLEQAAIRELREEVGVAEAGWFTIDRLPDLPPSISIARQMIDAFVARIRRSA